MPDRYGDRFADDSDPDIIRIANPDLIAGCELCDEHGYVGGTVCDHQNHADAARRGMDMIREAMGWPQP